MLGYNRSELSRRNAENVVIRTFGTNTFGISRGISLRDFIGLEAVYYIG
jgi:hypothetical protein